MEDFILDELHNILDKFNVDFSVGVPRNNGEGIGRHHYSRRAWPSSAKIDHPHIHRALLARPVAAAKAPKSIAAVAGGTVVPQPLAHLHK